MVGIAVFGASDRIADGPRLLPQDRPHTTPSDDGGSNFRLGLANAAPAFHGDWIALLQVAIATAMSLPTRVIVQKGFSLCFC